MTPQRARELLDYGRPNERADCGRCFRANVPCYLEPEHLFDDEPAAIVCEPCAESIARSHAKPRAAVPSLSLNL